MKKIIIITLTTILPSFGLVSCHRSEQKAPTPNTKIYSLYSIKQQALPTTLRLPAQLNPYETVNIYPKVNGYIKDMYVDMGSKVKQGQVLMLMEAPEVEQNSVGAHETYLKAQATYNESKDKYSRLLKAAETSGAVSPNDLQAAQSKMQADSAWGNSEKANWMSMQSMKDYLTVRAPFDGTITQRNIHPGALVTMGNKDAKPMLELQQTTKLRLQVNVQETYATQLGANQTISFTAEGLPGKTFTGIISRQANSLDEKFRSETIEIDVLNTDSLLMPGMYVEVLLPLKGHENALLVPQSAVVTSTERKYVIKANDNKASLVDVQTGNENNGMVEVFGRIAPGDSIISIADDNIKQNQVIR